MVGEGQAATGEHAQVLANRVRSRAGRAVNVA